MYIKVVSPAKGLFSMLLGNQLDTTLDYSDLEIVF